MVYNFGIYQGKDNGISAEYKELGFGGSAVICFVENLPQNKIFKVFFHKFFTGIPLLTEHRNKGL